MDFIYLPLMIVAAILLLLLLIRIIKLPLKLFFKVFLHAGIGFIALFLLNFLGDYINLSLDVNLFNALIAGILGVPGVILLLLFKYLL